MSLSLPLYTPSFVSALSNISERAGSQCYIHVYLRQVLTHNIVMV